MLLQHVGIILVLLFVTSGARSAEWEGTWQRGGVSVVTWSHSGRCATLNLSDEVLRLEVLSKEAGAYMGTYALLRQDLLVYADSPDCVGSDPARVPMRARTLARDVRGSLGAQGDLQVTLMFGDCMGDDCPSSSISRHRLRLAGNELASDTMLNGGLTSAPFLRQSTRIAQLMQAKHDAAPVLATIRQIDCVAMYESFLPQIQATTDRTTWVNACERSASAVGRPEARRTIAEHIFTSAESGFSLPTMLRVSGVDTLGGSRITEFIVVVRDASGWRLAFIGWV